MGKDQLAISRGRTGPHSSRSTDTPPSTPRDDELLPRHPLSVLALAAGVRLDDPRQEHERVVMLEVAIIAGREAARTFNRWLSQALAEYRGSRTAWDLEATTTELRLELDRFDAIMRETADRLTALIPSLRDAMPGYAPFSPARSSRRQWVLDEVAAASLLLNDGGTPFACARPPFLSAHRDAPGISDCPDLHPP